MPGHKIHIEAVTHKRHIPLELLQSADPSVRQIDKYLKTGICYVASRDGKTVGVLVLDQVDSTSMEVKNIAVEKTEQGKGFGKALLRHAVTIGREGGFKKLVICTGNSSIGQLALYQKEGFEIKGIEKDYFTRNYAEPIFENGIQCRHKIILEKKLTNQEDNSF